MIIKKIKIKNIRSYESQELSFPSGSLVLSGDIGSGKTSILLAIEYALFGLQPGQKGSSLLRNGCESGEVSLELEVDGHNVIIERKLKRDASSVSNDYSAITIDGEKTEYSVTELKTKILSLLSYPSEFIKKNNVLYRFTVYTPQEHMKQIILEDSETRLNVLRHVFGIDKYKRMRENLSLLLTKLKEDSKLLQGEVKTLDADLTKIELMKNSLSSYGGKIKEKELEVESKKQLRRAVESEVKELEGKIKEREFFEKEVEKAKIMISTKKDNLFSADRELSEISKSLLESSEIFEEIELKQTLAKIISKKEEIEGLNAQLVEITTNIRATEKQKKDSIASKDRVFSMAMCPTCLQDVPDTHKHNILNETEKKIADFSKALVLLESEKEKIRPLIEKSRIELLKLEEKKAHLDVLKSKTAYIERSKKRIEELKKIKTTLESDLSLLVKHMDSLKEEISGFLKFTNLFKSKQEDLKKSFVAEKNSEISLAEIKKELELTIKEISSLQEVIVNKEKLKKKLQDIQELSSWLSSQFLNLIEFTERNVLIKLRMEFSSIFGKWFNMLVPNDTFKVQLDENFTPLIIQNESEMEYSFLSGGERTAVALAYRLALNQTINSVLSEIKTKDLVILDEPTEGFSEAQLDKMRDVLEELKVKQLIIVSHEPKIEGFVDNVLKLKKELGVSALDLASSP